jgi:hypothetical protein
MSGKLRFCECGRKTDKGCRLCSECRAVNDQIAKDIYNASERGQQAQERYNKSEKGKISRHRAEKEWRNKNRSAIKDRKAKWNRDNKERVSEYNRLYYQRKKRGSGAVGA